MLKKLTTWYKAIPGYTIWILLVLFYFTTGAQISTLRGIYHALVLTSLQAIVYHVNLHRFLPKYYDHQKNKFRLANAVLIMSLVVLGTIAEAVFHHFLPQYSHPNFNLLGPFIFYTILALMAFWVGMTQYLVDKQEKNNIEIESLKRDKAENELKFLKTQINPHFLFNALNNIYSMAYTGDRSTPEKITMLSDMLRYVLYECESDYISLYKEVDYISSFLEFQQLKTEERQNIVFEAENYDDNYQIAPMLLVTFVENAFKHSKIEKDKEGFVKIELSQEPGRFHFVVENSIPDELPNQQSSFNKGIGIENAKNRLALLYPGKHRLDISSTGKEHKVVLELMR